MPERRRDEQGKGAELGGGRGVKQKRGRARRGAGGPPFPSADGAALRSALEVYRLCREGAAAAVPADPLPLVDLDKARLPGVPALPAAQHARE